jgi:hypothetical protein
LHRGVLTDNLHSTVRSFLPSRAVVVRTGIAALFIASSASSAHAQTSDAATPMTPARKAWDSGDFNRVATLCQKVLDSGGLARADVVEAYTRLGAALAITRHSKQALAAFRRAALVDPTFAVPPHAGTRAEALADAARQAQEKRGSLALSLEMPELVDAGSSIGIDVTVTPANEAGVAAITFDATDTLTAKSYEDRSTNASRPHFDVPARLSLPDASLLVRVHARDSHDNELAETDRRVHVAGRPAPVPTGPLAALSPTPAAPVTPSSHATQNERPSSGGFWSSPWPYIVGGAALAAGGAATWFLTRPTDNVDVGSAHVQLVH